MMTSDIAKGGKSIYGASLGILMLDARFPRIPGDMGHAGSWPFPVLYRIVRDASPDRVVRKGAEGMLPAFIDAAQQLVADGADGITTNCGFLALFQKALSDAVPVPVLTSSLCQVDMVNRMLAPDRRAGILTISGSTLTHAHLDAAHVPDGTPIGSTEDGQEFTRAILENEPQMDIAKARSDNVQAALALQQSHPELGAIVLECTNMGPYARDITHATGLACFSMITLAQWFQAGLVPPRFAAHDA